MKTFCPNCEKETNSSFICEVYECHECGQDFSSYEKPQLVTTVKHMLKLAESERDYWKSQACKSLKHMMEQTAFLRKIMTLGLLRGSPRLRDEALRILDGFEQSDFEGSATQKVPEDECPIDL